MSTGPEQAEQMNEDERSLYRRAAIIADRLSRHELVVYDPAYRLCKVDFERDSGDICLMSWATESLAVRRQLTQEPNQVIQNAVAAWLVRQCGGVIPHSFNPRCCSVLVRTPLTIHLPISFAFLRDGSDILREETPDDFGVPVTSAVYPDLLRLQRLIQETVESYCFRVETATETVVSLHHMDTGISLYQRNRNTHEAIRGCLLARSESYGVRQAFAAWLMLVCEAVYSPSRGEGFHFVVQRTPGGNAEFMDRGGTQWPADVLLRHGADVRAGLDRLDHSPVTRSSLFQDRLLSLELLYRMTRRHGGFVSTPAEAENPYEEAFREAERSSAEVSIQLLSREMQLRHLVDSAMGSFFDQSPSARVRVDFDHERIQVRRLGPQSNVSVSLRGDRYEPEVRQAFAAWLLLVGRSEAVRSPNGTITFRVERITTEVPAIWEWSPEQLLELGSVWWRQLVTDFDRGHIAIRYTTLSPQPPEPIGALGPDPDGFVGPFESRWTVAERFASLVHHIVSHRLFDLADTEVWMDPEASSISVYHRGDLGGEESAVIPEELTHGLRSTLGAWLILVCDAEIVQDLFPPTRGRLRAQIRHFPNLQEPFRARSGRVYTASELRDQEDVFRRAVAAYGIQAAAPDPPSAGPVPLSEARTTLDEQQIAALVAWSRDEFDKDFSQTDARVAEIVEWVKSLPERGDLVRLQLIPQQEPETLAVHAVYLPYGGPPSTPGYGWQNRGRTLVIQGIDLSNVHLLYAAMSKEAHIFAVWPQGSNMREVVILRWLPQRAATAPARRRLLN